MIIQTAEPPIPKSQGDTTQKHHEFCSNQDKFFTLTLDLFFIASPDGYWQQVNPMCEQLLGYSSQEFKARPWIEWVHPEDRQMTLAQLQKLRDCEKIVSFENRYRCKDGSYKWLLWNITLCHTQNLIYAVARDNTQRREAEAAHRESEERFRLLVDGVKDYAIIMLDPEGKIVSWNPGAERIKQYRATEILGQHVRCFYTPEDIAQGQPDKCLKIAAQQGRVEQEGWRVRKDGSTFFANVVITALRGEDGQLRGFARVTQDITERKFAQETLKRTNDELEKRVANRTTELLQINERLKQEIALHQQAEVALAEETHYVTDLLQKLQQAQTKLIHTEKMSSLGQVVAGVAHEINNPVSFIYGNIDYAICYLRDLMQLVELYGRHYPQPVADIQKRITDIDLDFLMADMPKLLNSMKVGANRIRQVVLSLQKFLKADQTEMKSADLHEGLESTLLILQHRLKPSVEHPEVTVIKDYGTLPLVDCYAGQINQVFMNLLTNAVDVLEASGGKTPHQIKLSTEVENISIKKPGASYCQKIPHAVIRIADNGLGMSQDVCQKLFEPFYTTKPLGKGTGLGLSISYQIIVENHGGQLTCQSQPGVGSEFIIAIPINQIITRLPELSLTPS